MNVSQGVPDGVSISYFENGNIAEIMTWSKGKTVGAHCRWSEDGELREVSSYVDGRMHGIYASLFGPAKNPADRTRIWEIDLYDNGKVAQRFRSKNIILQKDQSIAPSSTTELSRAGRVPPVDKEAMERAKKTLEEGKKDLEQAPQE